MQIEVVEHKQEVVACAVSSIPEIIKGISLAQAQNYIREMYKTPEFADGIIKPTKQTTLVIVDRLIDFLRYKDDQRFKWGEIYGKENGYSVISDDWIDRTCDDNQ